MDQYRQYLTLWVALCILAGTGLAGRSLSRRGPVDGCRCIKRSAGYALAGQNLPENAWLVSGDEEVIATIREIRDQIERFIRELIAYRH